MMPHRVTLKRRGAPNRYGTREITETISDIHALVERKNRMVRDAAGNEAVASTAVYLDDVYDVKPVDYLLLPEETDNTESSPILAVESYPDEHGDYVEVVHKQ